MPQSCHWSVSGFTPRPLRIKPTPQGRSWNEELLFEKNVLSLEHLKAVDYVYIYIGMELGKRKATVRVITSKNDL